MSARNLLLRSIAKGVRENLLTSEGLRFIAFLDQLLDSNLTAYTVDELIDLYHRTRPINAGILHLRSHEYDLDLPDFPKASSLKTHVVELGVNDNTIVVPHNLGEVYEVIVQGRYAADPPGILRQFDIGTDIQVTTAYQPATLTSSSASVYVAGVFVTGVYVSGSFTTITNWQQNTAYNIGDLVIQHSRLYLCLTNHTSSDNGPAAYDSDFYQDRSRHYWWLISQYIRIDNPNGHTIDQVLFVYHRNYFAGKQRIAYHRKEINSWKFTRTALELYLRYLLDDNADIKVKEKVTITRLFLFYNYDSVTGTDNAAVIGILKMDPPLPAAASYDGRNLSLDDPLIFSNTSVFNPITISVRADLQPDIQRFVLETVRNKLIPLPTWLASQVTITWDDYTQDWI